MLMIFLGMKGSTANVDRQLVFALALIIDDMPQQPVRRPLDVADLRDHLRATHRTA